MTLAELLDWWVLWNDEPWGELRGDMRLAADFSLRWGDVNASPFYPYYDAPLTVDEYREEMAAVEQQIAENEAKRHGKRRENHD